MVCFVQLMLPVYPADTFLQDLVTFVCIFFGKTVVILHFI